MFKRAFFQNIDWVVFFMALSLSFMGLSVIYSFDGNNIAFWKQSISLVVSVIIFFVVSQIDIYFLKNSKFIFFLYLISLFLLILLFFAGSAFSGAQSWFSLGLFAFQPTDLTKIAMVILLAKYFFKRHIEIKRIKHLFLSAIYPGFLFIVLALQPDFGSAIIVFFIWFGFILIAGIPKKYIFSLVLAGLGLIFIFYNFVFATYQQNRILTFLDPSRDPLGAGYNISQAHIALGSGGLWGKGISSGTQNRLNFLPQGNTDFIFSAYGEEWGFVGIMVLFLVFSVLIYRLVQKAILGRTNFESLIISGIIVYFFVHFFIHTGINLGILPVTGTTMPFMSYGGSHLIVEYITLGLINAISKTNRSFHRSQLKETDIIG